MYPKILGMDNVISTESFKMSMERECICPLIVTRGLDQMEISSRYQSRDNDAVTRNYGLLLLQL